MIILANNLSEKKDLNKRFKNKKIFNNIFKHTTTFFTIFLFLIFLAILGFLIYKSIDAFSAYGIQNILFTSNFQFSSTFVQGQQVSFWVPFGITLLTTFVAILISAPIGVKTAIFIKFRVNRKYKKTLKIAFETLAGIPSVIFGLFAIQSLGVISKYVFNVDTSYAIINASIMLSFMILPTIISITLNSLDNVDYNLLFNPIALGVTKTKAIYKVYKKAAKSGIIIGVILAIGRAIGEAMAVSMILTSINYDNISGFNNLFSSSLSTISGFISRYMFADSLGTIPESLLFAFGLILFILIGLINVLILFISKSKNRSSFFLNRFSFFKKNSDIVFDFFKKVYYFIICKINIIIEKFLFWNNKNPKKYNLIKNKKDNNISTIDEALNYAKYREENYKAKNIYSYYKLFWEIVSVTICFGFLFWLSFDILIRGGIAATSSFQTIFSYTKGTTGQAFFNTILIILVSVSISLPLAILISVFISEYLKNKKTKSVINFFIDAFGSTPSILYGLFGLLVFIQIFGWTSSGIRGNSLFAGALTILIVILPNLIRSISLSFNQVPMEIKMNALALGSSKFDMIRKIIIPYIFTGIITATILSIGRIFGESAPLYLTAGLTSSAYSTLSTPGQTLTTRIYAQLFNSSVSSTQSLSIMYESAFLLIILIFFLIFLAYVIIPNWKKIKKEINSKINFFFFYVKNIFIRGN